MKKLVPNLLMMLLLLFSCSKDSTTESSSSNSLTAAVEEKNAENASNINTKKALSARVTYRRDVFSDGTPVPRLVGFNWADEDDNFQRRPLVLSGMSMVYDNGYKLTQSKKEIYDMAKKLYMKYIEVGANTVRIPINHKTTRQSNDVEREYFDKYIQIIRAAVDIPNFHVIISYWPDGKNAGIPKGTIFQPYWKETWEPIVAIYKNNPQVYFEPINEPWGYRDDKIKEYYESWLSMHGFYNAALQHRVILGGSGISEDVQSIGRKFKECLLSYHMYHFVWWFRNGGTHEIPPNPGNIGIKTQFASAIIRQDIEEVAKRTILTEFGNVTTDSQNNYLSDDFNSGVACVRAMTELAYNYGMGAVYWPGTRKDDEYSMFPGDAIEQGNHVGRLTPNSNSSFQRLTAAWKNDTSNKWSASSVFYDPNRTYKIRLKANRNRYLTAYSDNYIYSASLGEGGAGAQSWKIHDAGNGFAYIRNLKNNKYLDVEGDNVRKGTYVLTYQFKGGNNQQWLVLEDPNTKAISITTKTAYRWTEGDQYLSLNVKGGDITSNKVSIVQWRYAGLKNDQWELIPE